MMAAVRADYDAKVAELKADLEATRGEKEKMETDLAYLKAASRTERLQWNKERNALSRKIAEADARAREAADGIASADEFLALQKRLASHESTIQSLRKTLDAKEAQQENLKYEAACGSTMQRDVDTLMVRAAKLEQALMQEREARKAAEQEAEARATEARGLERRLAAALEAAARAEQSAAASIEDVSKITAEVRDARAGKRHAELWLEKSLAEVDAVHAALAYERSVASDTRNNTLMQQHAPYPADHAMQTPQPNPPNPRGGGRPPSPADHAMQTPQPNLHREPPSPSYAAEGGCDSGTGGGCRTEGCEAAVGPTAQTPTPESPTAILAGLGGGSGGGGGGVPVGAKIDLHHAAGAVGAASTLPSFPRSPTSSVRSPTDSGVQTPELDVTKPELFSTTRFRSRVGRRGRGMGLAGEDGDDEDDQLAATVVRGEGGRRGGGGGGDLPSPPTPTVLFGALAGDGEPTRWGTAAARGAPHQHTGGAGEGNSRDTGSAAAKAVTMRMATTPPKAGVSNGDGVSSGAREDVAASLLSMLRLETGKRKQAEARVAELENAAADAAAAAAAASAAVTSPRQQQDGIFNANGDTAATGDYSGASPFVRRACGFDAVNGQLPLNGQASLSGAPTSTGTSQEPPAFDWSARFAKADQERQATKILGLVRDARTNMAKISSGGGRFDRFDVSTTPSGAADPPGEVASLIHQFDRKLAQVADDNAQLRVFCNHLEGLLASATHAAAADGAGGNEHREAVGNGVAGSGRARLSSSGAATATAGGWCDRSVSVAESSGKQRPSPPFALQRESLGAVRRGLPGTSQQVC
eukprot:g2823.t1